MRYSLFEDGHDEEGVSEEMGRPRAAAEAIAGARNQRKTAISSSEGLGRNL